MRNTCESHGIGDSEDSCDFRSAFPGNSHIDRSKEHPILLKHQEHGQSVLHVAREPFSHEKSWYIITAMFPVTRIDFSNARMLLVSLSIYVSKITATAMRNLFCRCSAQRHASVVPALSRG